MSEKQFALNQRLKSISRVSLLGYLASTKPSVEQAYFITFYYKAIDIFDGIIQLHKFNLDECGQALSRVLLETYLKFLHFSKIVADGGYEAAINDINECMMIMKGKDASAQKNSLKEDKFTKYIDDIKKIESKYTKDEIVLIKKHGFSRMTVSQLAEKYKKEILYDVLYRNFSRSVHAHDTMEYMLKQGFTTSEEYMEARNNVVLDKSFLLLLEMMKHMDEKLSLKIEDELKKILGSYLEIIQKNE